MTLYQHRRREHTTELYFMLNEDSRDVTISVLKCLGKFRCPLVNCLKSYTNITTFTKHAKRDHDANVTVPVNDNDSDDLNAMNCLKRKGMTMDCDSFSLIDGTQNALKLVSKRKAFHTAGLLDCEPLALHLSHSSMTDPYKVYGLFHANDVSDIYNKVPFESSSISTSLNCTIQLHTEDHNIQPTNISESNDTLHYLKQTVRASTLPGLLRKNDFLEPTQEILEHLNFDFRLDPALLYAVAKLHTGALIIDKEVVFCLAAEAYGRSKAVDIHGEADLKSLPSPSNSVYKSLSVGVHEESDGNGSKLKLKIGSCVEKN
ncbi:hypothetical protein RMCBS344292_19395 [Rhizopus microsporus]|nr:hypothetical protein RMCBS344292_19395 [Rhizopus microsporus]